MYFPFCGPNLMEKNIHNEMRFMAASKEQIGHRKSWIHGMRAGMTPETQVLGS